MKLISGILFFVLSVYVTDARAAPGPAEVRASGSTYVARKSGGNEWYQGEMNALGAGGEAFAGADGVGAMGRATLGEIGGKVGPSWISVGGKLGLSADTGVKIGTNTEAKVLGTGFGFGYEKGFEVCFFGSCLSVG